MEAACDVSEIRLKPQTGNLKLHLLKSFKTLLIERFSSPYHQAKDYSLLLRWILKFPELIGKIMSPLLEIFEDTMDEKLGELVVTAITEILMMNAELDAEQRAAWLRSFEALVSGQETSVKDLNRKIHQLYAVISSLEKSLTDSRQDAQRKEAIKVELLSRLRTSDAQLLELRNCLQDLKHEHSEKILELQDEADASSQERSRLEAEVLKLQDELVEVECFMNRPASLSISSSASVERSEKNGDTNAGAGDGDTKKAGRSNSVGAHAVTIAELEQRLAESNLQLMVEHGENDDLVEKLCEANEEREDLIEQVNELEQQVADMSERLKKTGSLRNLFGGR